MSGTNVTPLVNFEQIPEQWEVPETLLEVQPQYALLGVLPFPARNLIIAGMTSSGTATPNTVYANITRPQQATALGGAGSQVEMTVIAYLATGCTIPLDIVCVSDASGAAAASGTFTLAGTAWTAAWTYAVMVGGVRYAVGLQSTDTPATAATAMAAAINANPQAPVTAATGGTGGVNVVVTAKNKGTEGNNINIRVSPAPGDALPTGVTCTVVAMAGGTTNPSIANAITAIGGTWYTYMAMPFQDATNVAALNAEFSRRFNAMTKLDGLAFVGFTGTFSGLLTQQADTNSQYIYDVALPSGDCGSPPCAWAGSMLGVISQALTNDPSLQLRGLTLPGIVGPPAANLLDDQEQNLMLEGGGSTFTVALDGTVAIQKVVSTYLTNAQGVPDPAFHEIMDAAVAIRIRYDWRTYCELIYPRNKLAPDGSIAAEYDTTVVTPSRRKASWAARCSYYAKQGWIVNVDAMVAAANVYIDPNNANRLNSSLPFVRIGNLEVDAGVLMPMIDSM